MKKYCSVCYRRISVNVNGKIYRHGFKKNRWILIDDPGFGIEEGYMKIDGSPCSGSGKIGLVLKQVERKNDRKKQSW